MPWNKVYLHRWSVFLEQVSDRYGKSPSFALVAAGGPTSVSEEMTLPQSPENLKKWQTDGRSNSWDPDLYCRTAISMEARTSIRQRLL